ncbi:MAG: 7-cyano-7-deazaguanine synthase QueC [Candidatus Altiarchaeales archaeon]|nr:MAG: 7-cyano-7-deazaguanine synthase QueC [Candidatus Altiarchaeales archaeon]RLI94927.1 MAG: 7-cyano-7-deazaguanine synthase QueC [Candidatus Altiarchaeales archaeon]RLI95180.1 MAG: 7-cyano-7-deazaguanine synthase QueC [Candidatus Altiarchaeales archaeon]HDO82417.1 7-cyano-7-deazaguanine synthase QueC [Candidatus Altiarchaeales archaeon]HEX55066.1 7-cyano-7-deazaguanine synthase QueC [Candidatus Altiarchaeales archaeon]
MAKKSVCLLSGGLDSSVTLAIAKSEGYEIYALTFIYGQTHSKEVESSKKVAMYFGVEEHKIVNLDLSGIVKSALTSDLEIPTGRTTEEIVGCEEIPPTYVPGRNIIFLSLALAYAETIDADSIFIGSNAIDFSGYPDCRPEFFEKFRELIEVGTKRGVEGKPIEIKTPIINLTKAEIIKRGLSLGVPFELTWSCYLGKEKACGKCDSCVLRLKGFREVGYEDPIEYEDSI